MAGNAQHKPSKRLRTAFVEHAEQLLRDMQLVVDSEVEGLRLELLLKAAEDRAQLEEDHAALHAERAHLEAERAAIQLREAALEQEKARMAGLCAMADVLHLNVGGQVCAATRATLCLKEDSMLGSMFSGRWDDRLARDSEGRIFVDAPPDIFMPLLDFLRQKRLEGPATPVEVPQLPEGRAATFTQFLRHYGVYDLVHPAAGDRWEPEYGCCSISGDGRTASAERCDTTGPLWNCAVALPGGGTGGPCTWAFDVTKTEVDQPWYWYSLAFATRSAEAAKHEFVQESGELVTFTDFLAPKHQTRLHVKVVVRDGHVIVYAGEEEEVSKPLPKDAASRPFRLVMAVCFPWIKVRIKDVQPVFD